jgi:nucleoid DNA-binding protein
MRRRLGTKAQIVAELSEVANEMVKKNKAKKAIDMLCDALTCSVKAGALREWMQYEFSAFAGELEDGKLE